MKQKRKVNGTLFALELLLLLACLYLGFTYIAATVSVMLSGNVVSGVVERSTSTRTGYVNQKGGNTKYLVNNTCTIKLDEPCEGITKIAKTEKMLAIQVLHKGTKVLVGINDLENNKFATVPIYGIYIGLISLGFLVLHTIICIIVKKKEDFFLFKMFLFL